MNELKQTWITKLQLELTFYLTSDKNEYNENKHEWIQKKTNMNE